MTPELAQPISVNASLAGRRWRHAWDVLVVLILRDLKAQYKRSIFGFGWALASPILQLIIFSTVFHNVLGSKIPHYPCFIYIGVLVWGWFQGSLGQSTGLITGNSALARQPGFPLALLPHVTVSVRLFHFAVAWPLLFGMLWHEGLRPNAAWWALPILLALQYFLAVGLAYPLASLNALHRDTQHIVSALLQLMMFVTPVFYDIHVVPEEFRSWFYLNPMTSLLEGWRAVLLTGEWPDTRRLWILAATALILIVAGRKIFITQSHRFVEEM